MARFSQALLQGLLNPTYQQGLFEAARGIGMTPALTMDQAQRKAMAEQKKQDQMGMLQTINQAQAAAEQGDMRALDMQRDNLMDIYSRADDPATQAMILDSIAGINAARPATQEVSTTRTAESIIKTEEALKDFEAREEQLTPSEQQARAALEQRLEVMKQNSKAVTQADSMKYQAKYQRILRENELAAQQEVAGRRALSSVSFGSEQYKKVAKRLKDSGFGDTVDKYEKDQYDLEAARAEADELRKSRAPLTAKEKQKLESYGFKPGGPDDITRDRKNLARIIEREAEDKIRIGSAENARIANAGILAHVKSTLQTIQEQGDLPFNLFDDLYNKIEDLSDEDMQALADQLRRPAGEELTEAQIQQEVIEFVQRKFPEQWKEATQRQENIAEEEELVQFLTADLLVQRGLATRTDGVVDLSGVDEEDIKQARREVERRRGVFGFLFNPNTDKEAVSRENESQENIVQSMGRGI